LSLFLHLSFETAIKLVVSYLIWLITAWCFCSFMLIKLHLQQIFSKWCLNFEFLDFNKSLSIISSWIKIYIFHKILKAAQCKGPLVFLLTLQFPISIKYMIISKSGVISSKMELIWISSLNPLNQSKCFLIISSHIKTYISLLYCYFAKVFWKSTFKNYCSII